MIGGPTRTILVSASRVGTRKLHMLRRRVKLPYGFLGRSIDESGMPYAPTERSLDTSRRIGIPAVPAVRTPGPTTGPIGTPLTPHPRLRQEVPRAIVVRRGSATRRLKRCQGPRTSNVISRKPSPYLKYTMENSTYGILTLHTAMEAK